jgi:predicted kinase
MEHIGAAIAKRLAVAEPAPLVVDNLGAFEQIEFNCKENFTQIAELAPQLVDSRYDYVQRVTLDFLANNKNMFLRRHSNGFVKDGHGDLRMEHIYIEGDKISLIDCIEFNNRFRINDVMNEAGFLSMELDYSKHIDLSDAFLRGFFTVYNDDDSHKLLNFYRCYRAVVRAKVAMFTMLGCEKDSADYTNKYNEYQRMMDMAVCYGLSITQIKPLVICGMIASGKSKRAHAFAERFPVARMNTDEERKRMAGMATEFNGVTDFQAGLYTKENSAKLYAQLGRTAQATMAAGRIPLVDGTFINADYRAAFEAEAQGAIYIEVAAPDDVIIARLKAREQKHIASDGRMIHYEQMKAQYEATKPARDLVLDGQSAPEANVAKLIDYLMGK